MAKAARWRAQTVWVDPVNAFDIHFPVDLIVRRMEIDPLGQGSVRFRSASGDPKSEQLIPPGRALSLDFGDNFFGKGDTDYVGTVWSLAGVQQIVLRWFT